MNDEEIQEVFQEDTEEKEEIQEEDVQEESSEDQNEKDEIENNKEETREEELEKEEVQKEEEIQEEIQEREEEIQELEEQENEIEEVLEEKEEEIEELEAEFDDREEEEEKVKEKNIESIEPKAIPKNNISNAIKEKLSEKYSTETQVETKETITETIKEEKQPKNTEVIQKIKEEPKVFVPKAKISDTEFYVDLGNRVFFDSYQSKINANTEIFWNFGDGKFVKNKKSVSHLYKKPGTYTVTLKLVHKGKQSTETAQVFVSKNTILLISDGTASNEQLNEIKESAKKQNAYLKIISVENEENSFALEEKMTRALQAEKLLLQNADYFVALTAGTAGVNSYNRALTAESIDTENKQIVALSTGKEVSNIEAKSIENNLKDENKSVLFSTIEATDTIFASSPDAVKKALESKDISYEEAKKDEIVFIHPLNFLSHIVALLVSKEVAPNIIMLILMLPIAATVVVFFRQIIGLSSFGIFTPALLAVTFLATGLSYGLLMFFVILIAG
jgi:PKD repeat protein